MKIIYVDCAAGVSGSALLGAMVNSGIDQDFLLNKIKDIVKGDYKLSFKKATVKDISATRVLLEVPAGEKAVPLVEFIEKEAGNVDSRDIVVDALYNVTMTYAAALSKLQNLPINEITMGQNEIIRMYIIAAGYFTALKILGAKKVLANPIPIYSTKASDSISDPLVLELARGLKVRQAANGSIASDALGVALLAASVDEFGQLPEILVNEIGYGLLENDSKEKATLRIMRGIDQTSGGAGCEKETVMVIETGIDDMNPEFFPYLIDRLLTLGALDAFLTPIYMKKGRPANLLTVLCRKELLEHALATIFKETTTLGVRIREEERRVLGRRFFEVNTPYGKVSVKAGYLGQGGKPVQMAPEFEDCKKIATAQNVPLKEVYAAAQRAADEKIK